MCKTQEVLKPSVILLCQWAIMAWQNNSSAAMANGSKKVLYHQCN
jgi:hypothetical protein